MKRILMVLTVALVMAAMLAVMAMPALAAGDPPSTIPGHARPAAEQEQTPIGPCSPGAPGHFDGECTFTV